MHLLKTLTGVLVARAIKNFHEEGVKKGYGKYKPNQLVIEQSNQNNNGTSDSRIVGGVKTNNQEFPWLVSIGSKLVPHNCGGTVIGEKVVVSAAHCIMGKTPTESYHVKYGLDKLDDQENVQTLQVSSIISHPEYKKVPMFNFNDIAIFILKDPIKDFKAISGAVTEATTTVDQSVIVAGWGATSFNGGASNDLLKVDLKTVSAEECKKTWLVMEDKTSICAEIKEGGKDACQGDSGGPLMSSDENGQYKLLGIVSVGKGCGDKDTPGVYSRVSAFLPWVKDETSKLGLTTTFG